MCIEKTYSVSELSLIAGVSIRTLHHYDKIGILKPNRRRDNVYREYTESHIISLQQIIVYRALDFRLDEIIKILNLDNFDRINAMKGQREILLKRQQETQSMINSIEVTLDMLQGQNNFKMLFKDFPESKTEKWNEMLEESYDEKKLNKVFSTFGKMSEEDANFEQIQNTEWANRYKTLTSHPVDSDIVQNLVREHYILSNRLLKRLYNEEEFQGIEYAEYLLMAERTISDPVSVEVCEHYKPGFAEHLHEAMMFFAENTLKEKVDEFKKLGNPT